MNDKKKSVDTNAKSQSYNDLGVCFIRKSTVYMLSSILESKLLAIKHQKPISMSSNIEYAPMPRYD